ncbi:MAG: family 78 glycoside hydrolase catalytic domain [Clostridia bacterium]|nr:family 78 glycoside hydrolase catalytic domain [Clostridia bacterium]
MIGKWITTSPEVTTPMFVKRFTVDSPKRVRLSITGLGYFFFTVNGQRVSRDLFTPAQTDYMPRDTASFTYPIHDTLTHKVLYLEYDITAFVSSGENTLEVVVGNGWFRQPERIAEGKTDYSDTLCAWFTIEIEDASGTRQTVYSDGSEDCFVYPILESNLFLGDVIDTRMFRSPLPEAPTYLFDGSRLGTLVRQTCPPDRVIRHIVPASLGGGLYDAKENVSGRVCLTVRGSAGDTVSVFHAEEICENDLDHASCGGGYRCQSGMPQLQQDRYILSGGEQTLCPEFAYHGFRYFKVEGNCQVLSLTVEVIHTDLPVTSSFSCSNETVNWLYDAFLRSLLSNFHGSIPSDCPHRERLGYTGDGQVTSLAGMLTLRSREAYRKWIDDILDCQCQKSGHVQHTAPFGGGGGGPGGWGCAIVFVVYQYDKVFGDEALLRGAFPSMLRWLSYLESRCENGLVVREEAGGWCLGDWCAPSETRLPAEFVNTACLVKAISLMEEISARLSIDTPELQGQKELHKKALFDAFYQNGSYLEGEQGADAFALWAGLTGDGLREALLRRYEARDTFDTGFLATEILCDQLFALGRGDLAVKLMGSDSETVGFHFMRKHGATTLWECMDSVHASHNHHMFGGCVHTLFTGILGVKLSGGNVFLAPSLNTGLAYAQGSLTLSQGSLSVRVEDGTVTVETEFPIEVILENKRTVAPVGKTVISKESLV